MNLKTQRSIWSRISVGIALVLLVTAGGICTAGDEVIANELGIVAFYLLALGVLLQIAAYIREQRAERRVKGSRGKDSGSGSIGEDRPAEDE